MSQEKSIRAIIWDYDGTLVDSRQKNLNVTRKIIEKVSGKEADSFPLLRLVDIYHKAAMETMNWREFYRDQFQLTEDQIDEAGGLWTKFQLSDETPVTAFSGIHEVISSAGEFPQGIVSQNSKSNVMRQLEKENLSRHFSSIIGYEEVALNNQKPHPEGMLKCIKQLCDMKEGNIFYIGDHETDILCAVNTNEALKESGTNLNVITIGASYGTGTQTDKWSVQPDYVAQTVGDLLEYFS